MQLNGVNVTAGQYVSAANITSGLLTFNPGAIISGINIASFTFQVQDNGGTANGGVDLDQSPNAITIDVPTFSIIGTTNTVNVNLTSIICPAGSDIAWGNNINPTNWESCSTTKAHTLSVGDGVKLVYARWRSAGGEISANFQRITYLDTTAPTGGSFTINAGATHTS